MLVLIETPDMLVWRSSVAVSVHLAVFIKFPIWRVTDSAVCSVSTAWKPLHSSQHFFWNKEGSGWESVNKAEALPATPQAEFLSEPLFQPQRMWRICQKYVASAFHLREWEWQEMIHSKTILNSGDILNITIRMVNSWIVSGWIIVVGMGWERNELTFSGIYHVTDILSHFIKILWGRHH